MVEGLDSTQGIVKAAAAWRIKYRKTGPKGEVLKIRLRIDNLGVHRSNRGGVYPAGVRCKSLCVDVMEVGLLKEELQHQMVVVEDAPFDHIRSRGKDYISGSAYNIAASRKDEFLCLCFKEPFNDVRHINLAHNHIVLVLRAFLTSSKWDLPPRLRTTLFMLMARAS